MAALTVVAVLTASLAISPAALAAPVIADPAPVDVTAVASLAKEASAAQVAPGDTFTYTLTVGCSSITDLGCRDAVLTDVVPAPFVVDVLIDEQARAPSGGRNRGLARQLADAGTTVDISFPSR